MLVAALCAPCGACGASEAPRLSAPAGASTAGLSPALDFAFDSLDSRPISAASTRGKPTVILFLTTSSLPAQAEVNFLMAMAKHDADRVNYAAVALAAPQDRELVELYAKSLSLPFPVAVLDPVAASATAFGDVSVVPVTVLLDRMGRVAWRAEARVARADEIRAAMRGL